MWMVYDNEEGLLGVFDNHQEAINEYEKCKQAQKDFINQNGEFQSGEMVILAKVERNFYSIETDEKQLDYTENGDEIETGDYYWSWKEEVL